ncbi:hypothetical protein C8Q78DRAFT_1075910 [Trametes maxima]|nr:hypothetical protein C8Q78DRAFT_1075910 [Trametes maxima]
MRTRILILSITGPLGAPPLNASPFPPSSGLASSPRSWEPQRVTAPARLRSLPESGQSTSSISSGSHSPPSPLLAAQLRPLHRAGDIAGSSHTPFRHRAFSALGVRSATGQALSIRPHPPAPILREGLPPLTPGPTAAGVIAMARARAHERT